jgi:type II secretory pathway predicted ATPase ExeA
MTQVEDPCRVQRLDRVLAFVVYQVMQEDEAHLLSPEQLEELRPLTNAEIDSASPFAPLLVGQPTLARQLRMGVFAALDQRIATHYQLAPMDLAEAATYLRHRISTELCRAVATYSGRTVCN